MSGREVVLKNGVSGDISKLAAGKDRADVALNALKEENLSPKQIEALKKLASKYGMAAVSVSSPLESERQNYDDSRSRLDVHPAIDFSVTLDPKIVAADHLRELLGEEDAKVVMSDWGNRIDFTKNVSGSNKAALFIDSNNKARNRDFAAKGASTTQEEDFKASGLEFADDLQATIICATLVKKAKDAGLDLSEDASSWKNDQPEALSQLNEAELDLLTKLRDGVVRSRSGALDVDDDGRLRANYVNDYGFAHRWAFGGVPSAE